MIIHDNGMVEGKPHEIIARRRENQIKASLKHGVNYTEYKSLEEAKKILDGMDQEVTIPYTGSVGMTERMIGDDE